eukprot:16096415-Heterocapsa_arctica.AAC.1
MVTEEPTDDEAAIVPGDGATDDEAAIVPDGQPGPGSEVGTDPGDWTDPQPLQQWLPAVPVDDDELP